VEIDHLISAVSELFAALRAAVGRMLLALAMMVAAGKGDHHVDRFRWQPRTVPPMTFAHGW